MKFQSLSRATIAGLAITLASGCSLLPSNSGYSDTYSARQNTSTNSKERIGNHIYAGIGFGASRLDPDTSQVPGIDVNDRVQSAGQLTLGIDLSRQLSIELHSADLGDADLSTDAAISYRVHGGSALLYFGKNRHNFKRQGLTGYGRLGYAYLDNSAEGDVVFERANDTHVLFGAGVEYMTRMGLGLRLEGISFDEDARYAQLGLIYRFGQRKQASEVVKTPAPIVAQPISTQIVEPVVVYEPEPVLDSCSQFAGTLEGVGFHSDSAELTAEAESILEDTAIRLSECPETPIAIAAHTDSQGDDDYNQNLSKERAKSVLRFLFERGIDINRMEARAFGESRPIDTNDTPEGRERNRRVELFTQ